MQATIERVGSRQVNTKFGEKTVYSFMANNVWYGSIWKDHGLHEGAVVEFEFQTNSKGYNDVSDIKVVGQQSPTTPQQTAPVGHLAQPAPANNTRQMQIHYQSSRHDAVQIVKGMVASEAIVLPAKTAARYSAYLAYVDEITLKLYSKLEEIEKTGEVEQLEDVPEELLG